MVLGTSEKPAGESVARIDNSHALRASQRDALMLRGHLIAQGDHGEDAEC